jgi:hypothetical protein
MKWPDRMLLLTGHDPILCPVCKKGRLLLVESRIIEPETARYGIRDPPQARGHALEQAVAP